ncbi:hypothetical protein Fmac_012915 [Flemingia macrophylla]|uniref:Uncharacterized protein n=1 Tax=Flemingia macrophylla TaxID=520843 RepID=A0ABD1MRP5_9FABA
MSGVLPGVECARRRRLHNSATTTRDSNTRSFSLYMRNLQSPFSSSSFLERNLWNQAYPDENLGGEARLAKQRLDRRFMAHIKSDSKHWDQKSRCFFHGLWRQLRSLGTHQGKILKMKNRGPASDKTCKSQKDVIKPCTDFVLLLIQESYKNQLCSEVLRH